jgi:hypothetical protein
MPMNKRVVVIASGETERRSLPHLVAHLQPEGIVVTEIRRPDNTKALSVEMAEKLVKAAWWAPADDVPPDKFVILLDADGNDPDQILQSFRDQLPQRLGSKITASIMFAVAQWHLEAWYFADDSGLRTYLNRDLGSVDTSAPDRILKTPSSI